MELVALENVVVRIEKCLAGFEHQGAAVVVLAHTLLGRANTTLLNALPVSDSELLSHLSQFVGLATVTKKLKKKLGNSFFDKVLLLIFK